MIFTIESYEELGELITSNIPLREKLRRSTRILFKPNVAYNLPPPITTNVDIVKALVDAIISITDAKLLLIEGATSKSLEKNLNTNGYYDLEKKGVQIMDVDDLECACTQINGMKIKQLYLPKLVSSCDFKISIPVLKIGKGSASISVKNLIGLLPRSYYRVGNSLTRRKLHIWNINKCIADIYFNIPFDLAVVDATMALQGKLPKRGKKIAFNKIVVSESLFEADKKSLGIAEMDWTSVPYMRYINDRRKNIKRLRQKKSA